MNEKRPERDIRTKGRIVGIEAISPGIVNGEGECAVRVETRDERGNLYFMGTFSGVKCVEVHVGDAWAVSHGSLGSASAAPEKGQ